MPRTKSKARKRANAGNGPKKSEKHSESTLQASHTLRKTRSMLDRCFSKADKKLKVDTTAEDIEQLAQESGLPQAQASELLRRLNKRQNKMRRQLKHNARREVVANSTTEGDNDLPQGKEAERARSKPKPRSIPKQPKVSKKLLQKPSYLEDDDFEYGQYEDNTDEDSELDDHELDWPIESTYECGGKSPSDSMAAGIVNAMMGGYDMWGF